MMSAAKRSVPKGQGLALPQLSLQEFKRIAHLAEETAGLSISENKRSLVQSRLLARMKISGMTTFKDYIDLLECQKGEGERNNMVASLTTNVTAFFREPHHFDQLKKDVFPELIERARAGGRVRIWSAGCSSGQEAYSLAMTLLELDTEIANYDVLILASDIDPKALSVGTEAIYSKDDLLDVPEKLRRSYFSETAGAGKFAATDDLRSLVCIRNLNLVGEWPMRRPFDVVFCRNVVIYFSRERQQSLWSRFSDNLSDSGWLFLGHSERLTGPAQHDFSSVGVTSYRKGPNCTAAMSQALSKDS